MDVARGPYRITDDPAAVDLEAVHAFLATSYWSPGIPRATVEKAVAHSLCLTLLRDGRLAGFGRAVTDRATFAYLADVFVLEGHRGRGLGAWLVETFRSHPDLQGLRRWLLATRDAHGLYRRYGFVDVPGSGTLMTVHDPDLYLRGEGR
jgi:GNAT superfamily N-acetyltransferase